MQLKSLYFCESVCCRANTIWMFSVNVQNWNKLSDFDTELHYVKAEISTNIKNARDLVSFGT